MLARQVILLLELLHQLSSSFLGIGKLKKKQKQKTLLSFPPSLSSFLHLFLPSSFSPSLPPTLSLFFLFLAVLVFELRALLLLGLETCPQSFCF
jgi:hypothetical protein